MAEEISATDAENSKSAVGSNKNYLVTILLLINAVVLGTVGYLQYMSSKKQQGTQTINQLVQKDMMGEAEGTATDPNLNEEGTLLQLNPFTANLAQGDGPRRYVRTTLVLKFDKNAKEVEFNSRKPQIRDIILGLLNTKRPEQLLKTEGKSFLKEEIKSHINTILVDGKVLDIFYISFQIQ